jgi:hypothetical protein
MGFLYESPARRRAALAGLIGACLVLLLGPLLAVPAVALVALVYYVHQLLAVLAGDEAVPHPDLALVIVVNALVVLLVQLVVFFEGLSLRT